MGLFSGVGRFDGGDGKGGKTWFEGPGGLASAALLAPATMGASFAVPAGAAAIRKIGDATRNPSNPVKNWKEDLARRWDLATNNPTALGMSGAEQGQMIRNAAEAARAQQQAAVTDLNQTALAGQGFQQGAFTDAVNQTGSITSEATAKAAADVNNLNRKIIDQQIAKAYTDLAAERDRVSQNTRYWMDMFMQLAGSAGMAAIGGGAPSGGVAGALPPVSSAGPGPV